MVEAHAAKSAESKEVQLACIQDDGTVHLILKVISKLCDGQHTELQVILWLADKYEILIAQEPLRISLFSAWQLRSESQK